MGFSAKLALVNSSTEPVFQGDGEEILDVGRVTVWRPISGYKIDFGRLTRLEKVVGERFRQLEHSSYARASICVMDPFLDILHAEDCDTQLAQVAPQILIPPWFGPSDSSLFDKCTYLDINTFSAETLEAMYRDRVERHNSLLAQVDGVANEIRRNAHVVLSDLVRWVPCSELVAALDAAEGSRTQAWCALEVDPVSLSIAKGWREVLRALSNTGARAVFLFDW